MKKYIFSLLALLMLASGVAVAQQNEGTVGANTKREIPGALGYVPYKEIQLVRYPVNLNAGGNNLSAGDVVVWDAVSDDGVTINLITSAVSTDAVAGVVVSTIIETADSVGTTPGMDYGRRNWGWMQVRGYCPTVNITSGPDSAGGVIVASKTARYATGPTIGWNRTQRPMGFAYDASSQGQAEAFLDL